MTLEKVGFVIRRKKKIAPIIDRVGFMIRRKKKNGPRQFVLEISHESEWIAQKVLV